MIYFGFVVFKRENAETWKTLGLKNYMPTEKMISKEVKSK